MVCSLVSHASQHAWRASFIFIKMLFFLIPQTANSLLFGAFWHRPTNGKALEGLADDVETVSIPARTMHNAEVLDASDPIQEVRFPSHSFSFPKKRWTRPQVCQVSAFIYADENEVASRQLLQEVQIFLFRWWPGSLGCYLSDPYASVWLLQALLDFNVFFSPGFCFPDGDRTVHKLLQLASLACICRDTHVRRRLKLTKGYDYFYLQLRIVSSGFLGVFDARSADIQD